MAVTYRMARAEDAEAIYSLIYELAEYENAADQVESTPDILREWIFGLRAILIKSIIAGRMSVEYSIKTKVTIHGEESFLGPGIVQLLSFFGIADCKLKSSAHLHSKQRLH